MKVRFESLEPDGKGLPILFTLSSACCTERSNAASPVLLVILALSTRPSRRMMTDTLAMRERASPLGISGSQVRRYTPTTKLAYEVKAALLAPVTFTLIAAESWVRRFLMFFRSLALTEGLLGWLFWVRAMAPSVVCVFLAILMGFLSGFKFAFLLEGLLGCVSFFGGVGVTFLGGVGVTFLGGVGVNFLGGVGVNFLGGVGVTFLGGVGVTMRRTGGWGIGLGVETR